MKVVNPTPGGGTSPSIAFTIQNAAPVLTALTPSSLKAGSAAFNLVVTGTGFMQAAQVQWGGAARPTTYVSATQVSAAIAAADVATAGLVDVTVRNPAPTVGPSNVLKVAVTSAPTPPPAGFPMRITVAPDGSPPNGPSGNGGMDMDGNYIIFASRASNLVAGDSNGAYDLYVRETCNHSVGSGSCTQVTRRILMADDGSQPNGDNGWRATSPEESLAVSFFGEHVAFVSSASNLVSGDTTNASDIFVHDRTSGQTARVSVGPGGRQANGRSVTPSITRP